MSKNLEEIKAACACLGGTVDHLKKAKEAIPEGVEYEGARVGMDNLIAAVKELLHSASNANFLVMAVDLEKKGDGT